jgi:prephenate dehydrogenase
MLVNQASEKKEDISFLDFAAGGFRDMTRIASSDFSLWKSILSYNKNEILDSLDSFAKATISLYDLLKESKFDEIEKLFTKARVERNEIPINTKGFIDPLYDITVFVKDEPGMISRISTVLFNNNINIKDIELLKIREGTGGNFKFYFESSVDANRAKILIEKIGFTIQ